MKPLVELSYTPNPLVADKCASTAFHYKGCNVRVANSDDDDVAEALRLLTLLLLLQTPPTDMAAYGQYVNDFVTAMVAYFGAEEVAQWRCTYPGPCCAILK